MPGPITYWNTIRPLRPVQIYGRLWFRLHSPEPDLSPPPPQRASNGRWEAPARRRPSLMGPSTARFLNREHNISSPTIWNDPALARLWLYNLHYFDDLNAQGAPDRRAWHSALLARWIKENPPGQGTGWEPYPTSLRLVNWIKAALGGAPLPGQALHSLAIQSRWLMNRLEHHLLGNHLLSNAKALVFAGAFFKEAEGWLSRGLAILEREIEEQILPDGGHFERSPMYHALALEDMLDLMNLGRAYPGVMGETVLAHWAERAQRMASWLAALCHPDGEIALFNDAAFGIAPPPAELERYASRLGLETMKPLSDGILHLPESGYIRLQQGPATLLLDVAPLGPDYLPGHGHADTLSFELSLYGKRLMVDSGTSLYEAGPQRHQERGTSAHNTVTVDGQDSSEVWGSFRVAKRAKPRHLAMAQGAHRIVVHCSHDGYGRLPGGPLHRRRWCLEDHGLTVEDRVEGPHGEALGYYHFHPAVEVTAGPGQQEGDLGGDLRARWRILRGEGQLMRTSYHPEFGRSLGNGCLRTRLGPSGSIVQFLWS